MRALKRNMINKAGESISLPGAGITGCQNDVRKRKSTNGWQSQLYSHKQQSLFRNSALNYRFAAWVTGVKWG